MQRPKKIQTFRGITVLTTINWVTRNGPETILDVTNIPCLDTEASICSESFIQLTIEEIIVYKTGSALLDCMLVVN